MGITEIEPHQPAYSEFLVLPNPFLRKTEIRYWMQDVSLEIRDILGRLIKSFNPLSSIPNQTSSIIWQGDDEHGHLLPPGVYFVCLKSKEFSAIRKVIKLGN